MVALRAKEIISQFIQAIQNRQIDMLFKLEIIDIQDLYVQFLEIPWSPNCRVLDSRV